MGRAAAFVFGATVAIAGCSATVGPDGGGQEDTGGRADVVVAVDTGPADNGSIVAAYGLPAPDAGVADTGNGGARYGAPPPPEDAGPDDNGGGSADYGSPPPIDGG